MPSLFSAFQIWCTIGSLLGVQLLVLEVSFQYLLSNRIQLSSGSFLKIVPFFSSFPRISVFNLCINKHHDLMITCCCYTCLCLIHLGHFIDYKYSLFFSVDYFYLMQLICNYDKQILMNRKSAGWQGWDMQCLKCIWCGFLPHLSFHRKWIMCGLFKELLLYQMLSQSQLVQYSA